MTTGEDKGKKPKESEWFHKASEKEVGFDLEHVNETLMKVKKTFSEASTSGSQGKQSKEMKPSMLAVVSSETNFLVV